MQTHYAAVRQYLQGAWLNVRGDDAMANQLREAIDYLIETVATAECSRPRRAGKVLHFPKRVGQN